MHRSYWINGESHLYRMTFYVLIAFGVRPEPQHTPLHSYTGTYCTSIHRLAFTHFVPATLDAFNNKSALLSTPILTVYFSLHFASLRIHSTRSVSNTTDTDQSHHIPLHMHGHIVSEVVAVMLFHRGQPKIFNQRHQQNE